MLSPDPLDCSDFGHSWERTGRVDHHAFTHDRLGYPLPKLTFLRCDRCGQDGYRDPRSKLIYTWNDE